MLGLGPLGWILSAGLGIAGGYQKIKSDRLATKSAESDAFMAQFNPASMVTRGFINNYSERDPDDPEGKRWIPNRDENPKRFKERHGGEHVKPYKQLFGISWLTKGGLIFPDKKQGS